MSNSPSSLLHWMGCKHDIANIVTKPFPSKMNVFHDVFLGGGSVLLHVLTNHQVSRAYAYDTNRDLIRFFITLQSTPEKLASAANTLQIRFNRIQRSHRDHLSAKTIHGRCCSDQTPHFTKHARSRNTNLQKHVTLVFGNFLYIFLL